MLESPSKLPHTSFDDQNSWHKMEKMENYSTLKGFSIFSIEKVSILSHFIPFYPILSHFMPLAPPPPQSNSLQDKPFHVHVNQFFDFPESCLKVTKFNRRPHSLRLSAEDTPSTPMFPVLTPTVGSNVSGVVFPNVCIVASAEFRMPYAVCYVSCAGCPLFQ